MFRGYVEQKDKKQKNPSNKIFFSYSISELDRVFFLFYLWLYDTKKAHKKPNGEN